MKRSQQTLALLACLVLCSPAMGKGDNSSSSDDSSKGGDSGSSGSSDQMGSAKDTSGMPERIVPTLLAGASPVAKEVAGEIQKDTQCKLIVPASLNDYYAAKARVDLYMQIIHPYEAIPALPPAAWNTANDYDAKISFDGPIQTLSSALNLGISIAKALHSNSTIASGTGTALQKQAFQRALLAALSKSGSQVAAVIPVSSVDVRDAASVIVALTAQNKNTALKNASAVPLSPDVPPLPSVPVAGPTTKKDGNDNPSLGTIQTLGQDGSDLQVNPVIQDAHIGMKQAAKKKQPDPGQKDTGKKVAKTPKGTSAPDPAAKPKDTTDDMSSMLALVSSIANDFALVRYVENTTAPVPNRDNAQLAKCFLSASLDYQGGAAVIKSSLLSPTKGADLAFLSASYELDTVQGKYVRSGMVTYLCKAPSVFMDTDKFPTNPTCKLWDAQ